MSGESEPRPSAWETLFVGRDADLRFLDLRWEEARQGVPQLVVLLADTGLGKTRLAQKFYERLSARQDLEEAYWPTSFLNEPKSLAVNPDLSSIQSTVMPWLWWGVRFQNPDSRNNPDRDPCQLVDHIPRLAPHMAPLLRERRVKELGKEAAWSLVQSAAAVIGIGGVFELPKSLMEIKGFVSSLNELRSGDGAQVSAGEEQARARKKAVDTILDFFGSLWSSPPEKRVPVILLLDDAQWADRETLAFTERLLGDATRNEWPLLVVCTHWEQPWQKHKEGLEALSSGFSESPASLVHLVERNRMVLGHAWGPRVLAPIRGANEDGLADLVQKALPGLKGSQREAILAKADGSPQYARDLIRKLLSDEDHFENEDVRAPLNEDGEEELEKVLNTEHQQLLQDLFDSIKEKGVKKVLGYGGIYGAQFIGELIVETAAEITKAQEEDAIREDLSRGRSPYVWIDDVGQGVSEFRQRRYWEIAKEHIGRTKKEKFEEALYDRMSEWHAEERHRALEPHDRREFLELWVRMGLDRDVNEATLPGLVGGLTELLRLYADQEAFVSAAAVAEQVMALESRHEGVLSHVTGWGLLDAGGALYRVGNLDAAIRFWNCLLERDLGPTAPEQDIVGGIYLRLGRAHGAQGDFAAQAEAYERAVRIHEALRETQGAEWLPEHQGSLATSYRLLGVARRDQGDLPSAREAFERAIQLRETLHQTLGSECLPGDLIDLARAYANLGLIQSDQGDLAGAVSTYKRAIDLQNSVAETLGSQWPSDYQDELAATHVNLGVACDQRGDPEAAIEAYERAIQIREALRETQGAQWLPEYQNNLAGAYANLGLARKAQGDFAAAAEAYEHAIRIRETLRETQGAQWLLEYQHDLAGAYLGLGALHHAQNDLEAAIEAYERAIRIREALRETLGAQWLPAHQSALAGAYSNLGVAQSNQGNPAAAIEAYERAIKILNTLRETLGAQWLPEYQSDLAGHYLNLGVAQKDQGNPAAAIEAYERAIEIGETLRETLGPQWPPSHQDSLAGVYSSLADMQDARGNPTAAMDLLEKAVRIREALRETQGAQWLPEYQNGLANAYMKRCTAHAAQRNSQAAVEDCKSAIAIRETLRERLGSQWPLESQKLLANAYLILSFAREAQGDLEAVLEAQERVVDLQESLRQTSGAQWSPDDQNDLAESYLRLGAAYQAQGNLDAAATAYEKTISLHEALHDSEGKHLEPSHQYGLSRLYTKLGDARRSQGNLDAAATAYEMTISLQEALRELLGQQWKPELQLGLAAVYVSLGLAQGQKKNFVEAVVAYERSIALREELGDALESRWPADDQRLLARIYVRCGSTRVAKGDLRAAASDFSRAIALEEAVRDAPGPDNARDVPENLLRAYGFRAAVFEELGITEDAAADRKRLEQLKRPAQDE